MGDEVFLCLQPYIQTSVARRKNHKLSFKFFGPFRVLERIGQVAYKLDLAPSSKVHPVFHVSQLKPCVRPHQQVKSRLPPPDAAFQVPMLVLQSRVRNKGHRTVAQVLVQWSGMSASEVTWEDRKTLKQLFPHAPAWGQVGSQEGGIVNGRDPPDSDTKADGQAFEGSPRPTRPRHEKRPPAWLSNGEWTQ